MINIDNEFGMKAHGEDNVWKNIFTKSGNLKSVSSTQLGQQLIFDEALTVLPQMRDWIENTSANVYRNELKAYFSNDEIILQKLVEVYFLLCGSIYGVDDRNNRIKSRHRKIQVIKDRVMSDLDYDLVWRFVEVAVDLSQYFSIEKYTTFHDRLQRTNINYSCSISEKILNKLANDAINAYYPTPMLTPPVHWSYKNNKLIGGYETFQYDLVRTNSFTVDYRNFGQKIFDSVNKIQSVAWKVNEDLLKQVRKDLTIPKKDDFINRDFPNDEKCMFDYDLDGEDEIFTKKQIENIRKERTIFNDKLGLYNAEAGDYESALGKYRNVKMAVNIAERYVNKTIWFPHSYDFRGRIYPLPVGLSPQGSDAVKAMLEYAEGEILNQTGTKWAFAYLASLFGDDKLEFYERIRSGQDLIDEDYKNADEPYQFKAHQIELKKFLKDNNYKFKGRVHLDACNSGSQFTSAITGDMDGCRATNVIPTYGKNGEQIRQDAYKLVADKALELTTTMLAKASDGEYKEILNLFKSLLEESGRNICKTPVMVSNYGGTAGGRANILYNMFRELGVPREFITKSNASKFAYIIGDSIHGVLNGGKAFETYIHKMNNALSSDNVPITWVMDDGFHVTHIKHKELKTKKVTCTLPGARRKTIINKKEFSKDLVSVMKMKSAISPNYIHSLDAELLRKVAMRMFEVGIEYLDYIHDSFGCHPNYVDFMLHITKDEFRKMVRRNPLLILDTQLREQIDPTNRKAKKELNKIVIPTMNSFNPKLGILDVVMESEWFFS